MDVFFNSKISLESIESKMILLGRRGK